MLGFKIWFELKLFKRRLRVGTNSATLFQIYVFILTRSENDDSYELVGLHLLKRTFSLLTNQRTVISLIAHA